MRSILLFFLVMSGLLWSYERYDKKSVEPTVVSIAQIKENQDASGTKVYMVECSGKQVEVAYVLSKKGVWERPMKDSIVTCFVTTASDKPQFMHGDVKNADIDKAFHKQRRLALVVFGFIMLSFLANRYEPDSEFAKKISGK